MKFLIVLAIGAGVLLLGAGMAAIVQALWNGVIVPSISVTGPISFWQAWGMLILCSILFKVFR